MRAASDEVEVVDTAEEAATLERPPLLVRRPLAAYLDAHGIGSGEVVAERIGEGHSNVTYLIRRGEVEVVLRRPPRPPLPPSAHDVLREGRLLAAIESSSRAPRILARCEDLAVVGAPFYIMEKVEGDVITTTIPSWLDTAEQRRRIAGELIDGLVEIHAIDWRACGLEGFGKATGYLGRQLRRFVGLWEHSRTRELPELERVTEWLAANMPESPPSTIVHGDYRLGNVMFAPGAPARLTAIFDWELATIGDPLADVGYLTATYVEPGDPADTMYESLSAVTRGEGFPPREELVAWYEERSGRAVGPVHWYRALALWKSAIFMEGNYRRFLAGNSDDPFLGLMDRGVPQLAEKAWEAAHATV